MDEKNALLYSVCFEEPKLHISFEDDDGRILVIEWIENNYPSFGIYTTDSIEDYIGSIGNIDWIVNIDNVKKYRKKIEHVLVDD